MMKKCFYCICLFYFVLFFVSCEQNKKNLQFFRYNQASNITSLDPAFARDEANSWAVLSIFNGLVQLNDSLEIVPCIAKSWDINQNGMEYVFHLKDDIFFHEHDLFQNKKRKVVADDFVYSFNRIIDKKVASPGAWLFNQLIDTSDIKKTFSAPNDSTFVIHLTKPFRPLLGILTMQYCSVVPKEIVEHYGKEFRKNPIGTGPFYFKKWVENEVLILFNNQNYFEKDDAGLNLPYLDGIRISFIDNKSTEFLDFLQGNLDVMTNLDANYKDILLDADGLLMEKYKSKIGFAKYPYLATEYIGVQLQTENTEFPSTNLLDKNFRKALNFSINRSAIVKYFRNGIGAPADAGIIPRGMPSYNPEIVKACHFNLDSAKFYMNKSNFKNETIKLYTNPSFAEISAFIAKQWNDVGIPTKVEIVKGPFLKEQMAKKYVNMFRASWITDYPDEESFFSMFVSSNPAPPNYTSFENKEFDDLYFYALSMNDDEERKKIYQKMDQILMESSPVFPVFYFESVRFFSNRVESLPTQAMNQLDLKKAKLSK